MKLPPGYGTVYRLSGKRRKPWVARKMIGKTLNNETRRTKIQYVTLGYFEKKQDALTALAMYNVDPYDPQKRAKTLQEAYDAWSVEYFPTIKQTSHYKAAWKVLTPLWERTLSELTLDDFQFIFDHSEKNAPTLTNVKLLLSLIYEYGVVHEYTLPAKRDMVSYIRIPKKNPNAITRKVFSADEIRDLWASQDDQMKRIALILIFTGLRVSELLELTPGDVDLSDQRISITHAKTPSGIREVPIGDKLLPLVEAFLEDERPPYEHVRKAFRKFKHTPHDTRHTFASMAAEAQIDQRLIDAILGHAGANMALKIYTHFSLESKLEVVNNLLEIC